MFSKRIIRILVFSFFIILLSYMIFTKQLGFYLHPKMYPYTYGFIIFLLLLVSYDGFHLIILRTPEHFMKKKEMFSSLIYLIPVILVFHLPNTSEDIELSNKVVNIVKVNTKDDIKNDILISTSDDVNEVETVDLNNRFEKEYTKPQVERYAKDDFFNTYLELYNSMDSILGEVVSLDGFVYTDELMDENHFVISRYHMSCCAADAQIIGVLVETDHNFTDNEWFNISGVISLEEIYFEATNTYETVFVFKDPKIEPIEPYETPYVFYEAP